MEPQFTLTLNNDDWGAIKIDSKRTGGFRAELYVVAQNPQDVSQIGYLHFISNGDTPDEAQASLERAIVETLAVGGQLSERRSGNPGRRAYDNLSWPAGGSFLDFHEASDRRRS